jgi:hypothetical protein
VESFGNAARSLARNPLGIIALFLLLVYGLACLVAGVGKFDPGERQPLIWFLVIFPFCILGTFYLLVANHHVKLYAPSDFRTDESFLHPLSADQSRARLESEIYEVTGLDKQFPTVAPTPSREEVASEYVLAQTLAFMHLESEFNKTIQRGGFSFGVVDPPAIFDGTVTYGGAIHCIDVKLLKSSKRADTLTRSIEQFERVAGTFRDVNRSHVSTVLILIIVTDFPANDFEAERIRIEKRFSGIPRLVRVVVRAYSFRDLKEEFGIVQPQ